MMVSPYGLEERTFILTGYNQDNPNASEVSRRFFNNFGYHIHPTTITRIWKSEGLRTGGHGGRRHGRNDEEMISLFNRYQGSVSRASSETGISKSSLYHRWKSLNLT